MQAGKKPDYVLRKLEASLGALRGAVDDYAARLRGEGSSNGQESAARPSGARTSAARSEVTITRLRGRIAASLRDMAAKVLGGQR